MMSGQVEFKIMQLIKKTGMMKYYAIYFCGCYYEYMILLKITLV